MTRSLKLGVIRILDTSCQAVDAVAYRPAVVKATIWWPWPWTCQFAKFGLWLDKRWGTDYQGFYPQGKCDVCRRRASWITVGGYDPDDPDDEAPETDDFMGNNPVNLCGWCDLDALNVEDVASFEIAKSKARAKSISWRWRS